MRGGDHQYDYWLPYNLWLGVSVEMRLYVNRINELFYLKDVSPMLPSTMFVSFEPLIGDIAKVNLKGIDWIIIGGESGPKHRPMKIEWARNLINQAIDQGVKVWFKQLGGLHSGGDINVFPEDLRIRQFPEGF